LLFVVGARPNFIKIAPLCILLSRAVAIPYKIVHTGQHYDPNMSDVFFEELNIPAPDFHLNIGSGSHGNQTGLMMIALEKLMQSQSFSAVVVIGNVNSTLAAALVAAKLNIPVAHIESGLRSFNRSMPEEVNRVVIDHVSDLLFAPTQLAMHNLENEGLLDRAVFSGDVMYDMILTGLELAGDQCRVLEKLDLEPGEYYLATLHHPYNVDEPNQLREIINGFAGLEKKVILSAHPRLRQRLDEFNIQPPDHIHILKPMGYLDFIVLEKNADRILTDSGGVQKEAFFVQTPCITLRPETEWVETIETNANILIKDRSARAIIEAVHLTLNPRYEKQPYGDGKASELIIRHLLSKYYD